MLPIRKPSRMPFLTHAFTRQPLGITDASGSAARMFPAFNCCLNSEKSEKCSGVYCRGGLSKILSISCCKLVRPRRGHQADRFEHPLDLLLARGLGLNHW